MTRDRILLAACCVAAPMVARAGSLVHVKTQVYGCEKALAARALNNPDNPRRGDPVWIAYVMGDGQCVKITPQSPWAVVGADDNGVTLLSYRGNVGRPGSFYVPTSSIDFAAADAPPADAPPADAPPADAPPLPAAPPGAGQPAAGPGQAGAAAGASPAQAVPGPDQLAPGEAASQPSPEAAGAAGPAAPSPPAPQSAPPPAPPSAPQANLPGPPPTDDKALADLKADIAKSGPSTGSVVMPLLAFLVLAAVAAGAWLFFRRRKAADKAHLWQLIEDEIELNAKALRLKRLQTVQRDEFGTLVFSKWEAAKKYYTDTRIMPIVAAQRFSSLPAGFAQLIDNFVEAASRRSDDAAPDEAANDLPHSPIVFDPRMRPQDYAAFCATALQEAGWETHIDPATRGEGADIIASQDGKTFVLQCKLADNAIGNEAVQQVHAAKAAQAAQYAAVVSNQPFTRAARQLAAISGVTLLHHDELSDFRPGAEW